MRALQKTLAIVAFLVLAPQTLRHAYMLWLEPRGSVLDKYDQPVKRHDNSNAPPVKDRPRRGHIGFQHLSRNNEPVLIRAARIKVLD